MNDDLKFWPNRDPFGGFLITARDNPRLRSLMCANGATRREVCGHAVYLWNLPEGRRLFSGAGVVDGRFVRGPASIEQRPETMIGYCAVVDLTDSISVRCDHFGMYPVFYSPEIITDRLHLAMMAVPHIDVPAALCAFHNDWLFGQQLNVKRTPVAGFRMLGVGERLVLRDRVKVERDAVFREALAPEEYRELIRQGADEVRSNLAAVLDANDRVTVAITGGRDSRINLAALVSLGRVREVNFRTLDIDDDLPIGSGLVKWCGGTYVPRAPVEDWALLTIESAYDRRRSTNFGTYHLMEPHSLKQCYQLNSEPNVLVAGGMGEAFRTMYVGQDFGTEVGEQAYSYARMQGLLRDLCGGERHFPGLFEEISSPLGETFEGLSGDTIADRLNDHYLNFRNRIHFRGLQQTSITGAVDFHPLMSPSLLRAARGLPPKERATELVLYDVTRALCPELVRLPYDKPWLADITRSPYFDPALGSVDALPLQPAPELVERARRDAPEPLKPCPEREPVDTAEAIAKRLEANLDQLSSGIFSDISTRPYREYMRWARRRMPLRWRCVASKVQALVDFESVSQASR